MSRGTRGEMISTLADAIVALQVDHPIRVAIDGRSAAGKTTIADELADSIRERDKEVIRASIDDFHGVDHRNPAKRNGWTPQSYYDEGYDYETFSELLLRPLGPGGNRRVRTTFFDSQQNALFPEVWHEVSDQAVAIIDGVFLLRPEIAHHWDYIIWLDIDMETMIERARQRDVEWVGSADIVEDRYRRHWIPVHELYEWLVDPASLAHAVVDNRDPAEPKLFRH